MIDSATRLKSEAAVNQNRLWKNIALGAGFAAVLAAPAALHAMVAPAPRPALQSKISAADSFVATCTAAALVDTRPDPAWVAASFDGDNCRAPNPPSAFDGENASRGQIIAAMAEVKNYKARVTAWQRCIADVVVSRTSAAVKQGKVIDASFVTIESHRITAGEQNKKKADQRVAAEVEAFNAPGSECN